MTRNEQGRFTTVDDFAPHTILDGYCVTCQGGCLVGFTNDPPPASESPPPHHPNFPGKQHVLPKPTQPRPAPAPPPPSSVLSEEEWREAIARRGEPTWRDNPNIWAHPTKRERLDWLMSQADIEYSARLSILDVLDREGWFGNVDGDGSGTALPPALPEQVMERIGGIPCSGHEDFAAGTWTFHREGECSAASEHVDCPCNVPGGPYFTHSGPCKR